ncbi:hypothetical protein [Actinokineospora globicatena]|uniref:hypothetical protein n=1 Tax=Actinokineospora globicatena TaxID=103729 RepID=UPI0020A2FD14|nr:hypothetical protein [Actinokineospora globicatena]MCP2302892.1 hypothetical protein [Actinokineospora globicatena]GLW78725.1 hypothetical protein Aglo01_32070 [Actinokineospora globicatena]GLW84607.1 hypothetical protein Aglo02_22470 [Actinokineospora globicatena]
MGWNSEQIAWIAGATAVVALLLVGGARIAAVVRLRRHRALIAQALDRMCALAAEPDTKPRLRGLGRDVVAVLLRQEEAALSPCELDDPTGNAQDLALLIAADAATTTVGPVHAQPPDDTVWEETAMPPSVRAHPDLHEVVARMSHSGNRLVAMGQMVVDVGAGIGLPEPDARESLGAALQRARVAVGEAARLAEDGDPLAALAALTSVDIPVPEAGFPGQAVADDLRTQVNTLARLGIRHRAALSERTATEVHEEWR